MRNNPIRELIAMMPRLAVVASLAVVTATGATRLMAEPDPIAQTALFGGEFAKPNGVGFVLAVSLQRNGAGLR